MLIPALLLFATHIQPADPSIPYRQPQLASGPGIVAMVFGGGSSVYFSSSSDEGKSFTRPVRVAETGALALGRHRGPRVAVVKDAIVVTAIAGMKTAVGPHSHGLPESGDLIVWRSTDGGKSWKKGGVVNDVPGAAREGLHALTARPDGTVFAAWLDLRSKGTQLYGALSKDGGLTWTKNTQIYSSPGGTICQCCHPSLAVDKDGSISVMWRNVLGESRDLYVISSKDGVHFGPARKLGSGTWKINACPMDGGGLSIEGGAVTSAWRRDEEIYITDASNREKHAGTGKDIALAKTKNGVYLAWTQNGAVQVLSPGQTAAKQVSSKGGFASLLPLPDGSVLAAWETPEAIDTQKLP